MFSQSVTGTTEDPALPILPLLMNTERMLPLLAQAAGLRLDNHQGLRCDIQVLSHKLGRRCTIRYTLTCTGVLGQQPLNPVALIGKVYGRPTSAERLHRRTVGLRSGPFYNTRPLCVPAPRMLVQDWGLVLQEYVDGADLQSVLSADEDDRALSLAGQWLARLHDAPPLAGLKTASLQQELEKLDRWCVYIAPHLTAAGAQRLRRTRQTLDQLGCQTPRYEPVMIHKDFYHGNILWDGRCVWVLDFDELSIGDPALDVGHFIAHLETLAYRRTGRLDAFAGATALFFRSYHEKTSRTLESRLPFYKAYTFLKLAATEVSRRQGKWEGMTQMLAGLACREVEHTGRS